MYWKSKQRLRKPSPSLPAAPPKMLVNTRLSLFARQNTDMPVRNAATYCGNNSQTATTLNTIQNRLNLFLISSLFR